MTPYRASPPERVFPPDEALARKIIAPALKQDEELLWAQRPRRGFVWHRRDLYLTLFSLVWTTFALFLIFDQIVAQRAIALRRMGREP